ncbi:MAG: SIS domain-containing protein [Desulfurococcales archaeon]|nr:SIS domain-containing protein [Desulfurococcales archaeon]
MSEGISILYEYYMDWGKSAERAYRAGLNTNIPSYYYNTNKYFFCGMGGSGIAGLYASFILESLGIQRVVGASTSYRIPPWVDRRTLVFAISFSGNTRETIRCTHNALARGARVILLSRDGKFEDMSRELNLYFFRVPEAPAPRAGLAGLLYGILGILVNMNILDPTRLEIESSIEIMKREIYEAIDAAEHLASTLYKARDKIPLIITGDSIWPVAYRVKNELAENAKTASLIGVMPESGHNDVEAWNNMDNLIPLVIWTGVTLEDKMIEAALEVTGFDSYIDIKPRGQSILIRLIWPSWIAGLMSVQLANLKGIDPMDIPTIKMYRKAVSEIF